MFWCNCIHGLLGANEPQYHWKDITDDFTAASDGKESRLFTEKLISSQTIPRL